MKKDMQGRRQRFINVIRQHCEAHDASCGGRPISLLDVLRTLKHNPPQRFGLWETIAGRDTFGIVALSGWDVDLDLEHQEDDVIKDVGSLFWRI